MKKILLLTLISFGFNALSQEFEPSTNDTTLYGVATESDFYGNIPLSNTDGASNSMYWEVDSVNLPSDWEFSVCDQDICYPIGTESVQWNLPGNGGYLNMHFYPNGQEGEGFVTLKVNDSPNENQTEYITFRGSALTSSVDKNSLDKVSIYPNPAIEYFKIAGGSANTDYKLINILGKEVKSGKLNENGNLKVNTSSMLKGVYIITFTENSQKITRKVIIR